jgi:hypothetical protein
VDHQTDPSANGSASKITEPPRTVASNGSPEEETWRTEL